MKIGLIQTRGIGDIVIAIPIASYFINLGYEVYWPIDQGFYQFFQEACPDIHFSPVYSPNKGLDSLEYFVKEPFNILNALNCDLIVCLYSYLSDLSIVNKRLAGSLKFDEYKYAATGVPFEEKWNLKIKRNYEREMTLFKRLNITGEYVVVQSEASNINMNIPIPEDIKQKYHIVNLTSITDNPFDWLYTLENAAMLFLIDSCFVNLVEQLGIGQNKHIIVKEGLATPVLKSKWKFH